MKIPTIIISLIIAVGLLACSKQGDSTTSEDGSAASVSSPKSKSLVPATAADVVASPDYKLEHTTKSGIQCYVRPLTPEIAKSVHDDSRDEEFLNGEDTSAPYFLVLIRNGKIIDTEAATDGAMTGSESGEVMGFIVKRDPKMQEMLKEAQKK
jgi:hypothetical protein